MFERLAARLPAVSAAILANELKLHLNLSPEEATFEA
jgi:hypothetical protein